LTFFLIFGILEKWVRIILLGILERKREAQMVAELMLYLVFAMPIVLCLVALYNMED